MKYPKLLALLLTILIPLIQAIPLTIPVNLYPRLPTILFHPDLHLSETRTHYHAILTHPLLKNTTARIWISSRPLTAHIHTATGFHLSRRILLKNTYEDAAIEAGDGTVNLHFRKRVPDLGQAIQFCARHARGECLRQLVGRVCLSSRKDDALRKLTSDDGDLEKVLENCQREEILVVGSRILIRLVFGGIVNGIVLVYGWGFLLAIASIPKEVVHMVSWASNLMRRIRDVGVKERLWKEVMRVI